MKMYRIEINRKVNKFKKRRRLKLISVSALLIATISILSFAPCTITKTKFTYPSGWPQPRYNFKTHPLSEEGFQLGRRLFYDPILSKDSTISCSSCHLQATGFTHVDHSLSHGINGSIGSRNSSTIMNLAWNQFFMWDGGVNHIEVLALAPITNLQEMGESMTHVVQKLNSSKFYRQKFQELYNDSVITGQHLLLAITQFIIQLNTFNSKYDKVMRHEIGIEFTQQELNGLKLFRANCASCHTEPLFTNGNFENNGLPIDTNLKDIGRIKITQLKQDSLKFKVPTLRNIQFTQPYMHDGRFKKLSEVINHYTIEKEISSTLSNKLARPIKLNPNEKIDLIAFLYTLTDKEFLFNPRYGYPKP